MISTRLVAKSIFSLGFTIILCPPVSGGVGLAFEEADGCAFWAAMGNAEMID